MPSKAIEKTVSLNKIGDKQDAKMQAPFTSSGWWDTVRWKAADTGPVALPGRGMVYAYTGLGSDGKIIQMDVGNLRVWETWLWSSGWNQNDSRLYGEGFSQLRTRDLPQSTGEQE